MNEAISPNTPSRRAVFTGAGALFAGAALIAPAGSPDMWDGEEPAGLHGVLNAALLRGLLGGVKP